MLLAPILWELQLPLYRSLSILMLRAYELPGTQPVQRFKYFNCLSIPLVLLQRHFCNTLLCSAVCRIAKYRDPAAILPFNIGPYCFNYKKLHLPDIANTRAVTGENWKEVSGPSGILHWVYWLSSFM